MRTKAASFSLIIILAVVIALSGEITASAQAAGTVYIGGFPITVDIENEGAIVVDPKIDDQNFPYSLNRNITIKKGDVITEIDGIKVSSSGDIDSIMANNKKGNAVMVKYKRAEIYEVTTVYPIKEECSGKYKLGFWLKDKICGLGTVTFICPNKTVAVLGHSIVDDETNVKIDCRTGSIFECQLTGIEKGKPGIPGRLKGRCVNCLYPKGEVYKNADIGLYGRYSGDTSSFPSFQTAPASSVKVGAAKIYTTIDNMPSFYDIEIVRAFKQTKSEQKGMTIKVTDNTLINKTGGIVQGMSGSPILQNGKIVGAVTHVFTNNPIMGYGVYSEWMLENAAEIA